MTGQTLTLLRHAKSSWNNPSQQDHERPLNTRGNNDARDMALRLKNQGSVPDLILCSSATRTRETTAHLLAIFAEPSPQVQYENDLYLASPQTLLASLAQVADTYQHIMIVAHNPGIEDLSAFLSGVADDVMPTAAVRQFSCPSVASLHQALDSSGRGRSNPMLANVELVHSDYPKSARQ